LQENGSRESASKLARGEIRMNILYLTSCFALGGTELYTLDYAECMVNRGHRVYWGTRKDGPMKNLAESKGIVLLPLSFEHRDPVSMFKALREIRRSVLANSIEVIHANDAFTAMVAVRALKGMKKAPKLIWSNVGIGSKSYALMKKMCGDAIDTIIAVSHFIRNRMIEEGFDPKKIVVYTQSRKMVDPQRSAQEIRAEMGVEDDFVIGTVGRVVKLKGVETLVEAMPQILKHSPNAKLVVVGDGPQRPELEELCRKLQISERVLFTGFRTDIENVYAAFDLVAFPTYFEALGYIPYEAMYYQKPLVASLTGGVPELVRHEFNGLLVPPAMPDQWADAILRLMSEPDLTAHLVKNGKEYFDKFLVNANESETIEKIYFGV